MKKGIAVIGCRNKMVCLGSERPFNVARKQDVLGKTVAEKIREVIMN